MTFHEIGGTIVNGGRSADLLKGARVSPDRPLKEAVEYLPADALGGVFGVCASREGRQYGPFPANATEVEIRTNGDIVVDSFRPGQTVEGQGVEAVATSQQSVTEMERRKGAATEVASAALEYLISRHGGLVQVLASRKRTLAEVLDLAKRLKLDLNVTVPVFFQNMAQLGLITPEHGQEVIAGIQQSTLFEGRDIFQDTRTVLDLFQQLAALDTFVDISTQGLVQLLKKMGLNVETFLKDWLLQTLSALLVAKVGAEQTVGQVLTAWGLPASQIDIRELDVAAIRQALQQVVEQWAQDTKVTGQAAVVEVTTSGPRLEIRQAVGFQVAYPGLAIPYVLTCRNVGDLVAENAVIVDILPENTEVVQPLPRSPLADGFAGQTAQGVAFIAWRCKKPLRPINLKGGQEVQLAYSIRATPGKWATKSVRRL